MAKAKATNTIAFQGEPGANSDMACRAAFPAMATLPCPTFDAAMSAVELVFEWQETRWRLPLDTTSPDHETYEESPPAEE